MVVTFGPTMTRPVAGLVSASHCRRNCTSRLRKALSTARADSVVLENDGVICHTGRVADRKGLFSYIRREARIAPDHPLSDPGAGEREQRSGEPAVPGPLSSKVQHRVCG